MLPALEALASRTRASQYGLLYGADCAFFSVSMTLHPFGARRRFFEGPLAGVVLFLAACPGAAPSIDTLALPGGRVGQAYEARLEASGPTDLTWGLADGRLPPGLALSKLGRILGTPEESGRFDLVVEVTGPTGASDKKALALQIGEGRPLTLHTTRFPEALVAVEYAARLEASGGVAPYRWSVTSGALPEGLAFSAEGERARLLGVAKEPGSYDFALEVRDDRGASVTRQVTLVVASERSPLRIDTQRLPPARSGRPYRADVFASGGAGGTMRWTVGEGQLPPGLRLSGYGAVGTVTGTPAESGDFDFSVSVLEALGARASRSLSIQVRDQPQLPTGTKVLPVSRLRQQYSTSLLTEDDGAEFQYRILEGVLPQGLVLVDDRITGVPGKAGRYELKMEVEEGGRTSNFTAILEVLDELQLEPEILPDGQVNQPYEASIVAEGAAGAMSLFVLSGKLLGLKSNEDDHRLQLSGTPTEPGTVSLSVSVTDGEGRKASRSYAFEIYAELVITTESLPQARFSDTFDVQLEASGGRAGPREWSVSKGSLPPGLTLDAGSGRLSGSVTSSGTFSFEARVTSEGGAAAAKTFELRVGGPAGAAATTVPASTPEAAVGEIPEAPSPDDALATPEAPPPEAQTTPDAPSTPEAPSPDAPSTPEAPSPDAASGPEGSDEQTPSSEGETATPGAEAPQVEGPSPDAASETPDTPPSSGATSRAPSGKASLAEEAPSTPEASAPAPAEPSSPESKASRPAKRRPPRTKTATPSATVETATSAGD